MSLGFWRLECKVDIFQTVVVSGATVSEHFEMIMIDWLKVHQSDRFHVVVLNMMVKVMVKIVTFTYPNNQIICLDIIQTLLHCIDDKCATHMI